LALIVREGQAALNEFVRIDAALADAIRRLDPVSESPRLDAELLLARALDVPRSYLFAHPEDTMDGDAHKRYFNAIDRRADGVPLAYITGEKEFWSMNLIVNPDTLVPRPETEVLVDQVLLLLPRRATSKILELGTGSGAIALAIAKERSLCDIAATDVSEAALNTAKENARQNNLPNVEFLHGNWFEPVVGRRFDIVVSNPPYVAVGDDHLENLQHEPTCALTSGADGLDAIRHIAAHAGQFFVNGGTLLLEHGEKQQEVVAEILLNEGLSDIKATNDLAGIPRVVAATWR
jgi:release factor glutamine methyltransferase